MGARMEGLAAVSGAIGTCIYLAVLADIKFRIILIVETHLRETVIGFHV
jgi:hypothetical protein